MLLGFIEKCKLFVLCKLFEKIRQKKIKIVLTFEKVYYILILALVER